MKLLGIVNVTRDSFSDGGRFLDPAAAIAHARELLRDGADVIDVGAESTHPDAEPVSVEEEIARLTPVVGALKAEGAAVSVDTCKPAVMRAMLALNVDYINDVDGFQDRQSVEAVRDTACRLIIMHRVASAELEDVAREHAVDPGSIVRRIEGFFDERVASLEAASIARERLIFDPGMGLFLSRDPAVSFAVLRELRGICERHGPVLVSTTRKSFIGAALGTVERPRPVNERGAATLATELWAARCGVEYIRTHDIRALRDALKVRSRILGQTA
uniref:dihydropteroate synthase n=1 Tax=uncultured organism TaxID=155900 RepID=A0A411I602_9ZZZZ|nr:hypothetical protein [uncultured organism]